MKTNELKKGDKVLLKNGWYADIADNLKGNTRLCKVYGLYTEFGSVYAWDIQYKVEKSDYAEKLIPIELTPSQKKAMVAVNNLFF